MPSNVAAYLSSGVSVGILAGVVSGLFYLVVAGFRWAGEVRQHSGDWFCNQFNRRVGTPAVGDVAHKSDGSIMESESTKIREFIERLVESLVSGGLDHVNVNRLYSHPDYKPLDESDSPSAAHAELKQLVQCVIREAMTLPQLHQLMENGSLKVATKDDDINSKSYEDILATAILNKVIERYQHRGLQATDGNSNLLCATREMESQPKFISRVEIGISSSSSLDETAPTSLDDASWSESSHTDPTSLTLEECIEEEEEVTTYSSEGSEPDASTTGAELDFYLSGLNFIKRHRVPFPEFGVDIVDGQVEEDEEERDSPQPTDLISPVDTWEENWLFQRRRLKAGGTHSPMPVPMLVPNPSEDYRALIGDRDAEETSDLSDCSDVVDDELLEEAVDSLELAEANNAEMANSIDSSSEFGQQDSEYTEAYASVTQRQMGSLRRNNGDLSLEDNFKPTPLPRTIPLAADFSEDSLDNVPTEPTHADATLSDLATPPRPGTIAEREHKKWESAAPLENNPYSSENILKRLNKSSLLDIRTNSCQTAVDAGYEPKEEKVQKHSQSDVARYGRDYYVNASKSSSGSAVKSQARPVEIVTTSTTEVISKPESQSKKCDETTPHVGSKVTRWQKEINQKEELWLKTIQSSKSEQEPKIETNSHRNSSDKTANTNGDNSCANNSAEKVNDIDLLLADQMPVVVRRQKNQNAENSTCNNLKNGVLSVDKGQTNNSSHVETIVSKLSNKKSSAESPAHTVASKAVVKSTVNGNGITSANGKVNREKKSASESSTTSSDGELTIAMPSVKDLAKQFVARSNTSTPTKSPSPVHRSPMLPAASVKANVPKLTPRHPMREVHSLTARSISRVFREELKRNAPGHSASDSSQSHPSDASDCSQLSDESSNAASPTPGSLRNNIHFWEQKRCNK